MKTSSLLTKMATDIRFVVVHLFLMISLRVFVLAFKLDLNMHIVNFPSKAESLLNFFLSFPSNQNENGSLPILFAPCT